MQPPCIGHVHAKRPVTFREIRSRPSHAHHSYLMSELPLVLDVAVSPGNQMSAKHALPGLESVLDRIPARDRPRRVRGDAGFGNEATLVVCESREVDYLILILPRFDGHFIV